MPYYRYYADGRKEERPRVGTATCSRCARELDWYEDSWWFKPGQIVCTRCEKAMSREWHYHTDG